MANAGRLFLLFAGVALAATGRADADDAPPPLTPSDLTPRLTKAEIPQAKENPDPRVEESLTISTEKLHGFSKNQVRRLAADRMAMLTSADEDGPGRHPAVDGFGDYRIGAGDILEFVSFDDESLNREVVVRYDGHVSLPRIRDVEVKGLTRREAEEALASAYGKIYRDPDISLTIVSTESKTYTVTGDVALPGSYPYTRATSLWQAISLAGGLAQDGTGDEGFIGITGQVTQAVIVRRINGERQVYAYDMRGLADPGVYEGDVPVYFDDIVYVPEGVNLVYVLGEAESSVTVELTQGMTLVQMLALSGGFDTSEARIKQIVLLREADENNTDVHLVNLKDILRGREPDIVLQPGDVVYIPRKRILKAAEFVERFTGTISPILDLYTTAIDAGFAFQLNREELDALEDSAAVSVGGGGGGITSVPRTLGTLPSR